MCGSCLDRARQLMCVILAAFMPSDELRPYVASLCDTMTGEGKLAAFAKCARPLPPSRPPAVYRRPAHGPSRVVNHITMPRARRYAAQLLEAMRECPPRTEMPSPLELEAIMAMSPLLCRVYARPAVRTGAHALTRAAIRYHLDGSYEWLPVQPWTTVELLNKARRDVT